MFLSLKCRAVANYIIEQINDFNSVRIMKEQVYLTVQRLQKLLYLCEVEYMIRNNGQSLFDDNFYAWSSGPTIEEIYNEFSISGFCFEIQPKHQQNEPLLSNDIKLIIDQILIATIEIDTVDLRNICIVANGPYDKVFNEHDKNHGQMIQKKDMYAFYLKQGIFSQLEQDNNKKLIKIKK